MNVETVPHIVAAVAERKGNYSLASFYRHKLKLRLEPVAGRQKPQLYPAGTTATILSALGLASDPTPAPAANGETLLARQLADSVGLHKLPELKRARALAKKGADK